MIPISKDLLDRLHPASMFDSYLDAYGKKAICRVASRANPYNRMPSTLAPSAAAKPSVGPPLMSNAFFKDLMHMMGAKSSNFRTLVAMADERHAHDPFGNVTASDLQALSRCITDPVASSSMEQLTVLANSGELARVIAGESTPTVRRAILAKLHRIGKELPFKMRDAVINLESGKKGIIVDYDPSTRHYLVDYSFFESEFVKPEGLAIVAAKSVKKNSPNRGYLSSVAASINGLPSIHPTSPSKLELDNNKVKSLSIKCAGEALHSIKFPAQPTLSFHGINTVKYESHDGKPYIKSAFANIVASVRTPMGAVVRLGIPVHIDMGKVIVPEWMVYGNRAMKIEQESVNNIFSKFAFVKEVPVQPFCVSDGPAVARINAENPGMFSEERKPITNTLQDGFASGYPFSM